MKLTKEQDLAKIEELKKYIDQNFQCEARRHQVKLELACIVFEQMSRYAESHPEMAEAVL